MSRTKIAVLGGAVTAGTSAKLDVMHDCFQYGTTTVNTVRDTQTWRAILSRILSDWVDGGVEVINAGKERDTAQKGLARLERQVLSASPGCVLLMFGAEDTLAGTGAQAFGKTLEQMIDAVRKANAKAVVVTPPPFSERMTAQRLGLEEVRGRQAALDGLAQAARGVSWKKSVPLVDLHAFFLGNRLAYDHLHEGWLPDGVAQSAMASFVAGELLGVLGGVGLPKVTLCDYRKAFSNPKENDWKHHAFTDLTFFEGSFYLTFREGFGHCPPPPPSGRIVVLRSADAISWVKEAVLRVPDVTHSADPKFLAVDRRLFVYTPCEVKPSTLVTYGFERLAPGQWSDHFECAPGVFWRPKRWRGQYLVTAYAVPGKDIEEKPAREAVAGPVVAVVPRSVGEKIYASADGRHWQLHSALFAYESHTGETDLWVEGDTLMAFSRHDPPEGNHYTLLSTFIESENRWETVSTGRIIQAPCVFKAGGRLFVTGRTCAYPDEEFPALTREFSKFCQQKPDANPTLAEKYHHGLRTGVFVMDGTRARQVAELLSAGDSSYPGVVQYGREYLISDYSMHEYYRPVETNTSWITPSDIYVSRLRIEA